MWELGTKYFVFILTCNSASYFMWKHDRMLLSRLFFFESGENEQEAKEETAHGGNASNEKCEQEQIIEMKTGNVQQNLYEKETKKIAENKRTKT